MTDTFSKEWKAGRGTTFYTFKTTVRGPQNLISMWMKSDLSTSIQRPAVADPPAPTKNPHQKTKSISCLVVTVGRNWSPSGSVCYRKEKSLTVQLMTGRCLSQHRWVSWPLTLTQIRPLLFTRKKGRRSGGSTGPILHGTSSKPAAWEWQEITKSVCFHPQHLCTFLCLFAPITASSWLFMRSRQKRSA